MSTVRKLTCIGCPMGCEITVELNEGKVLSVTGNTCKNGEIYANKECTNPRRIVTSTVRVSGGKLNVVSVKTEKDIPKNKIFDCISQLKKIEVNAPVKIGDVILKDAAGTGINVIASKNVDRI